MAYTEPEKELIRTILGYSSYGVHNFPVLDNAIRDSQSEADGGFMPDSSVENAVRTLLTEFTANEELRLSYLAPTIASEIGKIKIDAARSLYLIKKRNKEIINAIAIRLNAQVNRDFYSTKGENGQLSPMANRWQGGGLY